MSILKWFSQKNIPVHYAGHPLSELSDLTFDRGSFCQRHGIPEENKIIILMYEAIIKKQKLISLDEETHTYKLANSDIEFKSVTEFIGTFFKPFDEEKIAKKLTQIQKYKEKARQIQK